MSKNKNNNELRPYKADKIANWPTWVKVFITKSWAAGAVFFFMFMSTAVFKLLSHPADRWLVTALVLILINEYFINMIIKNMQRKGHTMNEYAMFINNKWSLVYNTFYILVVVILTIAIGGFIISQGISLSKIFMPMEDATWEPIMFGLLFYAIDTFLIGIKRLISNKLKKGSIK